MLKRTIGRSLLTLLVVTGLAGTVKDNSISKQERKTAINIMKETRDEALRSVDGLSTVQLKFRSAPGTWSVKECMIHLAIAEKSLWLLIENTMKLPANPEKRSEIKMTDEEIIQAATDGNSAILSAEPVQLKNTGFSSVKQAAESFKSNRSNHIRYLKNSTEDLRNHVVQLPFGWLDCYQLSLFIAAHSKQHTQQINDIKANPAFPR